MIAVEMQQFANRTAGASEMVDLVFCRRKEELSQKETYRDFVKFYGRVVFDNTQAWPKSYAVIRFP